MKFPTQLYKCRYYFISHCKDPGTWTNQDSMESHSRVLLPLLKSFQRLKGAHRVLLWHEWWRAEASGWGLDTRLGRDSKLGLRVEIWWNLIKTSRIHKIIHFLGIKWSNTAFFFLKSHRLKLAGVFFFGFSAINSMKGTKVHPPSDRCGFPLYLNSPKGTPVIRRGKAFGGTYFRVQNEELVT